MKTFLAWTGALALFALLAAALAASAGWYDIGADKPHAQAVSSFLQWVRMRSVDAHAGDASAAIPDDAATVERGATHYAEMCAGCHLAPGAQDRELHDGLYPTPPDLSRHRVDPATAFWVVKHGLKMTGMPAWGKSHDDDAIRAIVAFVRKLPGMDEASYRRWTTAQEGESAHGHHAREQDASRGVMSRPAAPSP